MAAAPATSGTAGDGTVKRGQSVSLSIQSEAIWYPGANRSTQLPSLEKLPGESEPNWEIMAPTVMAFGALAGDTLHASWPERFASPAATTTVTPEAIVLAMAS